MELTKQEQEIIDLTVEIWNKIIALPELHPMDNQETCTNIHDIQNRIYARIVKRNITQNK